MEPIAKVLEAVSGSAVTHPVAALACGCDLQHKADALPNSGPPLPPFLPSSTLTVFPMGDIQPFTMVGTSPPRNPGKLSAPGMTPYLYWVLLQASCLRPSLHAP